MRTKLAALSIITALALAGCSAQATEQPTDVLTVEVTKTATVEATVTVTVTATPTPDPSASTPAPSTNPLASILTPESAQRILGEAALTDLTMTEQHGEGAFSRQYVNYTGVTKNEAGNYNEVGIEVLSGGTSTRAARLNDYKANSSLTLKMLPQLGENAFAYWSADDYGGGTNCGVMWGEGDTTYWVSAGHIVPSKTAPTLIAEVEANYKARNN